MSDVPTKTARSGEVHPKSLERHVVPKPCSVPRKLTVVTVATPAPSTTPSEWKPTPPDAASSGLSGAYLVRKTSTAPSSYTATTSSGATPSTSPAYTCAKSLGPIWMPCR